MQDLRGDTGVAVAKAREDWLNELDLRFQAWSSKLTLRVYLAIGAAVGILKFDPSAEVTATGAGLLAAVKGVSFLIARN